MEQYKKIGHIMSTHGLKGEVKVFLLTDTPEEFFKPQMEVFLKQPDQTYKKEIVTSYRPTPKNTCLICFEGIDFISKAELINKFDIYAVKKEIKGRIYLADLVNMKVIGKKGEELGKVDNILNISGKSYLSIDSHLVPYIPDVFILSIDEKEKTITLTEQGEDVLTNA